MVIEHQIFIDCPAARVWEATTNISAWPLWSPTVQSARRLEHGAFGTGSAARIKQPLQPTTIWRVTNYEEGTFFAWETAGKIFRMRATHSVVARGSGTGCKLTIEMIGPLARLLGPLLYPLIKMALKQENHGLKQWCESRGVAHSPSKIVPT